jgi:ribonuclease P protein component
MIRAISRLPREEFASRRYIATRTPYFSVKVKDNGSGLRRLGVVAGKAVAKTAVERNFLKRQARAILQKEIRSGMDVLVIFSPGVSSLGKRRLRETLREATIRAQS